MVTIAEGDPKVLFFISYYTNCREEHYFFPKIAPLYPRYIMLSVKQGGIKYHFLNLWYDSTWDWNLVYQAIGKHYPLGQWNGIKYMICKLTL